MSALVPCPIVVREREVIRNFRCSDDPLDIFDGFVLWRGAVLRSSRRWFGQGPGKYGDWLSSRVVFQGIELDYGDDPRIFVANGKVCIYANIRTREHGFRNHLIEVEGPGRWQRYFLMPPHDVQPGKNWSPFTTRDGRLAFVHSFSPLRILREVKRETGIILLRADEFPGLAAEDGDGSGYPAHRGGTNGITTGKHVVGIGHTTKVAHDPEGGYVKSPGAYYVDDNQLIHRPFFWKLDLEANSVQAWTIEHPWDPRYWVVDPTSLLPRDDGVLEFYTTEVETSFVDPASRACTVRYVASLI